MLVRIRAIRGQCYVLLKPNVLLAGQNWPPATPVPYARPLSFELTVCGRLAVVSLQSPQAPSRKAQHSCWSAFLPNDMCSAQAGDTVVVHLLNRLTYPVNLVPSGLNTSAVEEDQIVAPSQVQTWTWTVPLDVRTRPQIDKLSTRQPILTRACF